jgi:hypothetical protein
MKRLVAGLIALASVSAFAQKSMVQFNGFADGGNSASVDFSNSSNDVEDAEEKVSNIALNYAYAVTEQIQVGLTYKSYSKTTDGDVGAVGDKSNTLGFDFFYNFDSVASGHYVGLHLHNTTVADSEAVDDSGNKQALTSLEYGHRFGLGKLWGASVAYAPSISYNMHKQTPNADGADAVNTTSLSWNWINFAVLF